MKISQIKIPKNKARDSVKQDKNDYLISECARYDIPAKDAKGAPNWEGLCLAQRSGARKKPGRPKWSSRQWLSLWFDFFLLRKAGMPTSKASLIIVKSEKYERLSAASLRVKYQQLISNQRLFKEMIGSFTKDLMAKAYGHKR